jgi:tetratricopeptide (TPR) repeat protein
MERPQERSAGALSRALARKIGRELEERGTSRGLEAGTPVRDEELDLGALDRSIEMALHRATRVREERDEAPAHLAELLALPAIDRETAVVVEPRFQSYTLASYVLERCAKAVFHDPAMARELARLARSIAAQADPRTCGGAAALADLESYALAMEGNALRVTGELRDGLVAFMSAREVQEKGGADPDLAGRIDLLEASLRRDIRQFGTALTLLDRAATTFATLRDNDQTARALINRANVFLVQRDLEKVISTLREALPLAEDSWLGLIIRHNLIMALADCGEAREAADLYEQSRNVYLQFPDPLTTSRRLWTEGLIARELGDLEAAHRLLSDSTERLAEQGYGFDAALAGLDLVAVYAKQGNADEVLRIASDLLRLFQLHNVQPEALAALRMVQEAAERKALDRAVLIQAAEMVRANQVRGASAD